MAEEWEKLDRERVSMTSQELGLSFLGLRRLDLPRSRPGGEITDDEVH